MLDELVKARGISLFESDGLLLIQFTKSGTVHPHVLQLGLMSEGRLEDALMPIFNSIVRERTMVANEMMRKRHVV